MDQRDNINQKANDYVIVKIAPIGTRTQNCHALPGLSIPGRDTYYMPCSVFICALRSFYSALNVIPLQLCIDHHDGNIMNGKIMMIDRQ